MKNLLLKSRIFLLLLSCIIITTIELRAQTYYPLPTQNAYWTVYEWDENRLVYDDLVYTVDGDTLLNNLQYTKVYKLNDHPTIFDTIRTLHCFMRQDNVEKKIWFIRHYLSETTEKLGYDFSVAIGDTISLPAFDYGNSGDSLYIRYEDGLAELNNGELRTEYHFSSIVSSTPQQFIEGTSNVLSTFPNILFFFDAFHQTFTQCVEINTYFIWPLGQDTTRCGFNFVNTVENETQVFNCFPNPAMNFTTINIPPLSTNSSLSLFDLLGNKLNQIQLIYGIKEYTLNLSSFSSGIYLLELRTPTFIAYNKLIINH